MTDYELLCSQVQEMIEADPRYVPALSNISALLMETLPDLNWAGFYILHENQLVVGPFQGKPACVHIQVGKGVCGTAVEKDEVINVPDVHQFPGHIACDSASNSEIVIPLHKDGKPAAVLDLDSPRTDRFTETDEAGLIRIAGAIERSVIWKER